MTYEQLGKPDRGLVTCRLHGAAIGPAGGSDVSVNDTGSVAFSIDGTSGADVPISSEQECRIVGHR